MKVGNLVRRKPHPITRQPELLGLVTEMFDDGSAIRVAFIDAESEPGRARYWRNSSHFEVVS